MISKATGAKPRYRSRKPVKTRGTDHLMPGDLYLGFSLVSLICTLVLLQYPLKSFKAPQSTSENPYKEKPRYRSRKSKETQGTDHRPPADLYLVFSLLSLICTLVLCLERLWAALWWLLGESGRVWRSQDEQDKPGGARRSQEQPREAGRRQQETRKSEEEPGGGWRS